MHPDELSVDSAIAMIMPFGKYRGRRLGNIAEDDPEYLTWLVTQCDHVKNFPALEVALALVHNEYVFDDDDE